MMEVKTWKTNALADGLIERSTSTFILDEIESKTVHKDEECDQ